MVLVLVVEGKSAFAYAAIKKMGVFGTENREFFEYEKLLCN